MKKIEEAFFECQRCGQLQIKCDLPILIIENKAFQVLFDTLYIDGLPIDDYKMVIHAIKRTAAKGLLEFNQNSYKIEDDVLYINEEEIGDYTIIVGAIKRAQELIKACSPTICVNPACGRTGPFKMVSPMIFEKALAAFEAGNYSVAETLFRTAESVYRSIKCSEKVNECQDFIKQCTDLRQEKK